MKNNLSTDGLPVLTVGELYGALDRRIDPKYACPWDNDGLAVCRDKNSAVTGIVLSLDATDDALDYAESRGCNVILAHHPLLFRGLREVSGDSAESRRVLRFLERGVSCMSFHTRLDACPGGVNDTLCRALGLRNTVPFDDGSPENLNAAGMPLGRIGCLDTPMSAAEFVTLVKKALHVPGVLYVDGGRTVTRVAVVGGAGSDMVNAAFGAGADAFLTGELKYHQMCDAPSLGRTLVAAGHYHTEFLILYELETAVRDVLGERGIRNLPVFVYGSNRICLSAD